VIREKIPVIRAGNGGWHGLRARATSAFTRSPGGPIPRRLTLLAPLLAVACGVASPLDHAASSPEALVQSALSAVSTEDPAGLESLLVTRDEYETLLWPEMPDREYTRFDFVWSLVDTNSRKGLRQVLSSYGGLDLELVSIEFDEEPEVYESFVMRPGAKVVVRRTDTGEQGVLPTFDVLVEYGGGWKLLNYHEL
jgi:hypothetical protein